MGSPVPPDEAVRLALLRHLRILDRASDARFGRAVRLAAAVADAPMAHLGFVDEDRVRLVSSVGLEGGEVPRDGSFCAHAILHPDLFVVDDALQDARFRGSPLVEGAPGLRSFAAFPLSLGGHSAVGCLAVADRVPRTFSAAQRSRLEDLGALVRDTLGLLATSVTDPGTGLLNRRGFESASHATLAACAKQSRTAAMVYIDLARPDPTLHAAEEERRSRTVASQLRACTRAGDLVGRLGELQYAVLCVGGAAKAGEVLLERFRSRLDDEAPGIAFQGGVAVYRGQRGDAPRPLQGQLRDEV